MRATVRLSDLPPDLQRKVRGVSLKSISEKQKYEQRVSDLKLKLKALGIPLPIREHQFAKEAMKRRWAFDFAWPEERVAMECDGGVFVQGRHSRGVGILKTHEKMNAAASLGWRVLYCVPKSVNAPETIAAIEAALRAERSDAPPT